MKVLSLDFETNITDDINAPTFRARDQDIYTQIWATHPDWVGVVHATTGFKRTLYKTIEEEIFYADYIVGHNIGFDLCYVINNKCIQDFILKGGQLWDCQYAEYLLTGQQHTTASLAELQLKYLGEQEKPNRISKLYKRGIGADEIIAAKNRCPRLWALYEYYCKTDGTTPLKIFKAQYIRAKKEGMLELIHMYNDYLISQILMSTTGIKLDVHKAEYLYREYNIKHLNYLKEAQEALKVVWQDRRLPEFNVNSPDHKSAVLFGGSIKCIVREQDGFYKPKPIYKTLISKSASGGEYRRICGYEKALPKYKNKEVFVRVDGYSLSTKHTTPAAKEGFYSTDEKVMSSIKEDSNTPIEVIKYCELQELSMKFKKAAKTYCLAFIERSVDGYLYPHFNNTITPTGRLTSSSPNLQNVPSKSDLAADLMGCFIAPEGYTCVSIDFSQLEKWTQALVSMDANLINLLEKGTCLHCVTLAKMEGLDYDWVYNKAKIKADPIWDAKRTDIKPVGFLMDYGGMPQRVAKETGMSLESVEEIYRIDKELYPEKYLFFEQKLPEAVKSSQTYSLACNISASKRRGKDGNQILGKGELLPIFDKSRNVYYTKEEFRHVGYWQTPYGKKYHFCDAGRIDKNGNVRRSFPMPKFKNYPNQGGAADIQSATTAELNKILITKSDKIKMFLEIHDSKLFYIRTDVLKSCCIWLKETIENVPSIFKKRFNVEIPFKFPVEFKIGCSFGDTHKYNVGE